MSGSIIEVSNLSKRYLISHETGKKQKSFRDALTNKAKGFTSLTKKEAEEINKREEFWALKDLNFEIKEGERIGIIGRNGAGKSTLLKILSRITEPSGGKISIKGRVASLLEVGTGFHPELTGRENIFLNGAILGMSRTEIKKKFDEIVAFAEVERFLDTPVKRYSSGMYVRLAFAVAAHLEPEILVVDEVLAVGDAEFQKKCLGKMEDVSKGSGRTILFVSHNSAAIQQLCSGCILLNKGQVAGVGGVNDMFSLYNSLQKSAGVVNKNRKANSIFINNISFKEDSNSYRNTIQVFDSFEVRIVLDFLETVNSAELSFEWKNDFFESFSHANNQDKQIKISGNKGEQKVFDVTFKNINFTPGAYSLTVWTGYHSEGYDKIDEALGIEVTQNPAIMRNQIYPGHVKTYIDVEWDEVK